MGKSSSLKRKRAKKSPSKVHDKSKSGRRSRKYKSKKVHRRDDSFSSSDEDCSQSSVSVSSSSTDDSFRKRKSRSCTRKYVKGRKKRARIHSCSTERSEDSARDRKRKRSKRKAVDSDVKKKKKSYKKKPRKEVSVSSTSTESKSCSTCQGGSEASDSKYEYESRTSRSERRENEGKHSEGGGNETNGYKSRSSTFSCNDSHGLYNEDKYEVEKYSRQLKSVITIPHDVEVDGKLPLDEMQNEEHGYKCFFSSSGSLPGSSKRREAVCQVEIECQKEAQAEIKKGDSNADVGSIFVGHKKDDRINDENTVVGDQYVGKETSKVYAAVGNFQSDSLESVLRGRALENLRKFRQELQTNGKDSDKKKWMNTVAKQNGVEKKEQSETIPTVGNGVVVGRMSAKESLVEGHPSASSVSTDNLSSSSNTEKTRDGDLGYHKSDPARHELPEVEDQSIPSPQASKVEPLLKREIVSQGCKNIVAHVNSSNSSVPKLSSSVPSLCPHCHYTLPYKDKGVSQETCPEEVSHTKQLENEFGFDGNASSEQTVAQGISNVEKDLDGDSSTLRSSSCKPSSNERSSNELQDESNDSSQFEQKKMHVMRGGEMVQVSYKVYIPKKAPALCRRQLKSKLAIMKVVHAGLGDDKYAPCPLLCAIRDVGHLGRKCGIGVYDYWKAKAHY